MRRRKPLSSTELALSTEGARRLLEDLRLESFFFAVEPAEQQWQLRLQCAIEGGWQLISFPIDRAQLQASLVDPELRALLLAEWDQQLAGCKRESTQVPAQPSP